MPKRRKIALLGAPTDIGAGERGGSMGPEALRVAGLQGALVNLGYEVEDRGNVQGPNLHVHVKDDGLKNLDGIVAWNKAIKEGYSAALKDDCIPVLLGGDHSLVIGSIAAAAEHCAQVGKPLSVLWLDAHADFNTSNTSPSGNIHGMPAAVITGTGHESLLSISDLRPILPGDRLVQIGIRSVDAHEKVLVNQAGIRVFDMRMIDEVRMKKVVEQALEHVARDGAHLHVSFDVDFLDPTIAPGVATTVRGGPHYREAQLCMEMISDSGILGSLDIVELNPAFDEKNKTAELAVELVESLFGKQILSQRNAAL